MHADGRTGSGAGLRSMDSPPRIGMIPGSTSAARSKVRAGARPRATRSRPGMLTTTAILASTRSGRQAEPASLAASRTAPDAAARGFSAVHAARRFPGRVGPRDTPSRVSLKDPGRSQTFLIGVGLRYDYRAKKTISTVVRRHGVEEKKPDLWPPIASICVDRRTV
jgi:hypothetical protein